jgi:hypothetical protein
MLEPKKYIDIHKKICILHPLNIPKYNVVASLLALELFGNEKLVIISDNADKINICFSNDFPSNMFYGYNKIIPTVKSKVYIIIDSIELFLKKQQMIKSYENNKNKCIFIFLTKIGLNKSQYEEYNKIVEDTKFVKLNLLYTHPHIKYRIERYINGGSNMKLERIIKYILLHPFDRQIIYTEDISKIQSEIKLLLNNYRKRCIFITKSDTEKMNEDKFAAWSSLSESSPYVMITDVLPKNSLYSVKILHIYGSIDYTTYYYWLYKIYSKRLYHISYDNLYIIFHLYNEKSEEDYGILSSSIAEEMEIYKYILDHSDTMVDTRTGIKIST